MKKGIAIFTLIAMTLSLLIGCSGTGENGAASGPVNSAMIMVGVAMGSEETCGAEGETMKTELEAAGYTVELAYAEDSKSQSGQIGAMVVDGASILIVDPVDAATAEETLNSVMVDVSDVAVIAYRDMVGGSAVDSYVGRDYYDMGKQAAKRVEKQLKLKKRKGRVSLEMVSNPGAAGVKAVEGALEVLQPYIDEGKVKIRSGNTTPEACATEDAAAWAEELCTGKYRKKELRAVLCLGEGLAETVVDTLTVSYAGSSYPIVISGDCSGKVLDALTRNLVDTALIYDDSNLTQQTIDAVLTKVNGGTLEEAYLVENTAVNRDNYQELLIDTGLYKQRKDGSYKKAA